MDINNLVRPDIAGMEAYTPIYPFEVLAARLGRKPEEIIKIDANENPFGPSPKVLESLANIEYAHIYPDPESRELRNYLADFTGVPAEYLMAGAGADELLDLTMRVFLRPGDSIVSCPPTFGMYSFDAAINQGKVISVPRNADYSVDVAAIEKAVLDADVMPKLLFVTSPNNPDGSWLADADLERLLSLPLVVVLDEAYIEFAGVERSRITQVPERDNLIVLRTFSKLAALAGMRIGYGAFPAALMPHLWKIKQPYNVPVAASTAAIAALMDIQVQLDRVQHIVEQRDAFIKTLDEIPFLQPYPSLSNFVLCKVLGRDAFGVKQNLEQQGILIRYYRKPGLQDHVRFTIGTADQMATVLAVLKRMV